MKVYLAGSYAYRKDAMDLARYIEEHVPDLECTSSWILGGEEAEDIARMGEQHFVDMDRDDVERSDVLLLVNKEEITTTSPGRWIEYGIALQRRMLCVVWGLGTESIFLHDRNTVIVTGSRSLLAHTLHTISISLYLKEQGELRAHRNDERRNSAGPGVNPEKRADQDRGEAISSGVFEREGSALSDLGRALRSRAERAGEYPERSRVSAPTTSPNASDVEK